METKKLLPHEKFVYRKTFEARVAAGCSVEGAHHQGLHAVKLWHEVGAFNEPLSQALEGTKSPREYEPFWKILYDWIDSVHVDLSTEQIDSLLNAMNDIDKPNATKDDFKEALRLIYDGSD